MKCPRCYQGDLFNKPFKFKDPLSMPERCNHCDQKFEPAPGFYYGAMFISYALSSFLFLAIAGIGIIFLGMTVNQVFAIIITLGILLFFYTARISRVLWIYFEVKYDPKAQ